MDKSEEKNFFLKIKGIIALDIDGTLTEEIHVLPEKVIAYLLTLYQEGWAFIFITGRTFNWGYALLKQIPFPYFFAAHNGAILMKMPSQILLSKKYLPAAICPPLEKICRPESTEFVVYSGFENGDKCYFRPSQFTGESLRYLKKRSSAQKEDWIELADFTDLPLTEFPSFKIFGEFGPLKRIVENIEDALEIHIPLNRDAFNSHYYVAQGTCLNVDKGEALRDILRFFPRHVPVIAAGDDQNDVTMLALADIKIAMSTAPAHMLESAHIIAPPAAEHGIIQGLKEAIKLLKEPP